MSYNKIKHNPLINEISKYYKLENNKDKILLVGHSSQLGGAQILVLNMIKEFLKQDIEVVLLIKNNDVLFESYKELVPTFLIDTSEKIEYYIKNLNKYGFQSAILNTVLSGDLIPLLKKYDFYTVSLIHELPGMINTLNAYEFGEIIAKCADVVVFPSKYVCEKFEDINKVQGKKIIQAQGLYNVYTDFNKTKSRQLLEKKYNIPHDSNIILNVGHGEKRKGFDIFFEVSQKLKDENYTFIWVGLINEEMGTYTEKIDYEKNIILPGFISDKDEIMSFYDACDLFFLSSREDPFPSVVLESFNAKRPVIGFENAGGFEDVVINDFNGYLVEYESIGEIINKIKLICEDEKLKERLGNNAKTICKNYNFSRYIKNLKKYCDEGIEIKLINSLKNDIKLKNNKIIKLKQENNEKKRKILSLKEDNSKLNENNSKLKKTNSKLKKNNSKLKKTNKRLKKEKKEILSSSSWKITGPFRKFKNSFKNMFKNKTETRKKNKPVSSSKNNQRTSITSEKYIYSLKKFYSTINYHKSYKTFLSNKKIKRINLFFDEIDESIYGLGKLFSFLINYCNQYKYSLRIIYSRADFQIFNDFFNKNNFLLSNISFINLKEDNYLEIGLSEKYVATSWENCEKLINTNNINTQIYFYLTDLNECTDEEYYQISKLCYNEKIIILTDNLSKLDKLKKFKYNYKFNINNKLNKLEKRLCYDLGDMPIEGIELLNHPFFKDLSKNWEIHITSDQNLFHFYSDSKKILTPISKKYENYDLFLNLKYETNVANNEDGDNLNNDYVTGVTDINYTDSNYINLYLQKESDDNYNFINISKYEMEEFHNFNLSKSKNDEFNQIEELFNKLMR